MHKLDIDVKEVSSKRYHHYVWIFLIIYLFILFYVTLFAWNYGSSYGPVGPGGRNYNLVLFRSIYNITVYSNSWLQPLIILVGNIFMFIPFGILTSLLFHRSLKMVVYVTILSFLLSLFIEVNQFIFTYRVADIDDLLLNTIGGFIGSLLVYLYDVIFK